MPPLDASHLRQNANYVPVESGTLLFCCCSHSLAIVVGHPFPSMRSNALGELLMVKIVLVFDVEIVPSTETLGRLLYESMSSSLLLLSLMVPPRKIKRNRKKKTNYEIDIENFRILKMASTNELTMRLPYTHRRIHTRLIHIKRKTLSSDITLAYKT